MRQYHDTACPSCGVSLDPPPKAKKRCPACGETVWVRSAPDGLTYLLRELDLPRLESRWADHHRAVASEEARRLSADAAAMTLEALRSYRELGVSAVELLGADDPCPACESAQGEYAIDRAPAIPVEGCAYDICRCDYAPVV